MLEASYLADFAHYEVDTYGSEDLEDQAFNFRDTKQGLNLDFMSYSMFSAAKRDPKALLNEEMMQQLASKAFSLFFQHYVSRNVSLEVGGWAYQPINASLPHDLLPTAGDDPLKPEELQPPSHTNRTAVVKISRQVEMLQTSPIAVWLSVSILAWLITTALVIAVVQRTQLKRLLRDVECIADVLLLVAGSENLLQLVREKGPFGLVDEGSFVAGLGWFQTRGGDMKWGIEIWEKEHGDHMEDYH